MTDDQSATLNRRLDMLEKQVKPLWDFLEQFGSAGMAKWEVLQNHHQILATLTTHVSDIKSRLDAMDQRLGTMDRKIDNLASQIGEVHIEVGAVKNRLARVEDTANKIAFEVKIPRLPDPEAAIQGLTEGA